MSDQHIGPEVIAQIAAGTLRGPDREAAIGHAERCESCRSDLAYVVRFERRRHRRRMAVIAGGIGLAALAVTLIPIGPTARPDPSRVRGTDEGIPNVESYVPANGSVVEGDSVRFAWQDVGPGTQYTLLLSTASGAPVLERAVRDTMLYVATSPLLERGATYLWLVDALKSDGSAATSAVWSFRLPN